MVTPRSLKYRMQIEDLILAELRQRKPARLLAEGAVAQALAQDFLMIHAASSMVESNELANLALAVLDAEEDKARALGLIGQLKQQAPAVLIAAHTESPLAFNDFLAFGMQRLAEADDGRLLYLFDLHTYKPAPDWLNARFWAHPELWKP
jgi:hypothetical protein